MASSPRNLEVENRRLKQEVKDLKEQLQKKDEIIMTLEARLKINSHTRKGMAASPNNSEISSAELPPRPKYDSVQALTPPDPMSSVALVPDDADGTLPTRFASGVQHHSPSIFNRQDVLESGYGTQIEGSILEVDDEEESSEANSEEFVVAKRKFQSAKGAIKALPRELSIFNSDGDDVTKYSQEDEDMPTYEMTKQEMRDAYNARGVYTGHVSRAEQLPHGQGRMEYHHQGRVYEGEWLMGHWHGTGMIKNAKGDIYEGDVHNDLKEGQGIMKFADGRVFKGEFKQDDAVKGTLAFPDGARYVGELRKGARHGQGTYYFTDGSKYEGESVNSIFHGKGKMTWNDGGWYEGEWVQGEIHGYGKEIRADGSLRHKGQWKNGVPIRQ